MDFKKHGFWKEYGWGSKRPSIKEETISFPSKDRPTVDVNVIEYLKSGISMTGQRMIVKSVITNEIVGVPTSYTDGKFLWTEEYIYYVKKGIIEVDPIFKNYMKENNFSLPAKDEIDSDTYARIKDILMSP